MVAKIIFFIYPTLRCIGGLPNLKFEEKVYIFMNVHKTAQSDCSHTIWKVLQTTLTKKYCKD